MVDRVVEMVLEIMCHLYKYCIRSPSLKREREYTTATVKHLKYRHKYPLASFPNDTLMQIFDFKERAMCTR